MSAGQEMTRQVLRARLRELVATAQPGERLPSDRTLSRRWGAARMTVRGATDALVDEGLVARRQGSGTYVLPPPVLRFLGMTSFTQDMRERGLVPGSRLLDFAMEAANGEAAASFRVPIGDPILRFTRLRLGSGEPMAIESVRIPSVLVPGLGPEDLDGSLYELLVRRYRITPSAATVTIEPILPDAGPRQLLAIAPSQACLQLRMSDVDHRNRVIMTAYCIYRGDRYQLSAHVPAAAFGQSAAASTVSRAG
jgi:GntR family transcriptional regulator